MRLQVHCSTIPTRKAPSPHSQEWVEEQFVGVADTEIDQMVRGNATRVFGFTF